MFRKGEKNLSKSPQRLCYRDKELQQCCRSAACHPKYVTWIIQYGEARLCPFSGQMLTWRVRQIRNPKVSIRTSRCDVKHALQTYTALGKVQHVLTYLFFIISFSFFIFKPPPTRTLFVFDLIFIYCFKILMFFSFMRLIRVTTQIEANAAKCNGMICEFCDNYEESSCRSRCSRACSQRLQLYLYKTLRSRVG